MEQFVKHHRRPTLTSLFSRIVNKLTFPVELKDPTQTFHFLSAGYDFDLFA
jgi:hypothetical protein